MLKKAEQRRLYNSTKSGKLNKVFVEKQASSHRLRVGDTVKVTAGKHRGVITSIKKLGSINAFLTLAIEVKSHHAKFMKGKGLKGLNVKTNISNLSLYREETKSVAKFSVVKRTSTVGDKTSTQTFRVFRDGTEVELKPLGKKYSKEAAATAEQKDESKSTASEVKVETEAKAETKAESKPKAKPKAKAKAKPKAGSKAKVSDTPK